MFPDSTGRIWPVEVSAVLFATLVFWATSARAQIPPPPNAGEGEKTACVCIEYETTLVDLGEGLAAAVKRRLGKHGVRVFTSADASGKIACGMEPAQSPEGPSTLVWIVHLRRLSASQLLVAIDSQFESSGDDVVQDLKKEGDDESTAWTIALMIDETVSPYLEEVGDRPAIGAGLAIIEPRAVGGVKKEQPTVDSQYPVFRGIGIGLALYGITATQELIFGPRLVLEGSMAEAAVAYFSIGWVGRADFSSDDGQIDGAVSLLPMDLMFGWIFLDTRLVDLTVLGGFSVGFAVFKTWTEESSRTDMLFQPWFNVALRARFKIQGPWAIFLGGGASIPFVQDVLTNNKSEVFRQGWILPSIDIGIYLSF